MTHPTPDSQITPPAERLDAETEDAMWYFESRIVAGQGVKEARTALRSRIRELVEEARKEVQGWKDIAESNRQAYADALHVNQYRDEGEIGAGFETVTLFTQNDIADLIELTKKVDANIHPSVEKLRRFIRRNDPTEMDR